MNTKQRVVILSAELTSESYVVNGVRSKALTKLLRDNGIKFGTGTGHYRGTTETSFVCLPTSNDQVTILRNLAFIDFNQESILIQDSYGISRLEYENGRTRILGRLQEYPIDQQEYRDNYTILNNRLWAV